MRKLIMGLCFGLVAAPALAETIALSDAKAHVGQTVTIEGTVADIHNGRSGATFLDIGGRFPNNAMTAVIFVDDLSKFPSVKALAGKTVAINGPVQLYRGKPEIVLKSAEQISAK